MTGRRSTLSSLALAFALVLSAVAITIAAAAPAAAQDDVVVRQGDTCYAPGSIGDGSENVSSFYDYRTYLPPAPNGSYSSYGTTHLQENQVSNLFLYNGSEGYSLVFLHDELGNDPPHASDYAPYGSTITFTITGLPEAGSWPVEDDDYKGRDDNFDHSGTTSEIDWIWADNRTDGGAFRGLNAEENVEITIDPAFNEEADEWGEDAIWSGDEDNKTEEWRLLGEGDSEVATLDMQENVTVETGPCDQTPPDAALSVNDSNVVVGETVELNATASSDNEDVVEYRWDVDGDGDVEETTESATITHAYENASEYDATVTAVDAAGNTDTASTTVDVSEPDTTPPEAALTVPATATTGEELTFDASGSDDNREITEYRWDVDGDGTDEHTTDSATTTHSYASAGEYDATVTVVDAADNTDTANATVNVTADAEPPEAALDAPSEALVGSNVTLDANASTDNTGIVEYRWDLDGDGTDERTTAEPVVTTSYDSTGEYAATVTVADEVGNTDTANANVTVTPDSTPPTATLDAPSEALVDQQVTLDANDSTDNAGIVEYRWDLDGDDEIDEMTDSATITHTYAAAGEYDATVTVADAENNTDTANATINVTADTQPPTAALDAPSEAGVNETIEFNASASTDNVGVETYHWDFDGDGTDERETDSPTTTYAYENASECEVTVTVVDDENNTDSASATVAVVEDAEPPAAALDAPATAGVGENVTLDASNSTDDGTIAEYRWDVNGDDEIDETTESPTLTTSYDAAGDYDVTVTVVDAAGHTASESAGVTVSSEDDGSDNGDDSGDDDSGDGEDGNSDDGGDGDQDVDTEPPEAALHIPETASAGEKVKYDASGSTDDGEIEEYRWDTNNDGHLDVNTTAPWKWDEHDVGTYTVSVTVVDTAGNTDTATTTFEVVDDHDDGDGSNDGSDGNDGDNNDGNDGDDGNDSNDDGDSDDNDNNAGSGGGGWSGGDADTDDDDSSDGDEDTSDSTDSSETGSPNVSVQSVHLSDEVVSLDELVDVTVTVTNTGDATGTFASNLTTGWNGTNGTVAGNITSVTAANVTSAGNATNATVDRNTTNATADGNATNATADGNATNATANGNATNATANSNATNLTVAPGEVWNVTYTTSFDEAGEYDVGFGNETVALTVNETNVDPGQTPDGTPTPTPDDTSTPTPDTPTDGTPTTTPNSPTETAETSSPTPTADGPGFGVIAALVAALLASLALSRRR